MIQQYTSRRRFIKTGISALASWPLLAANKIKVYHIGFQADAFSDKIRKDPETTLRAIAGVGFKEIEQANYIHQHFFGLSPQRFRQLLDQTGLSVPTGHTVLTKADWKAGTNDISDTWKRTIDDALTVGQRYIFSPVFDWDIRSTDEVKRGIEAYNRCGELCQQAGINFGYRTEEKVIRQTYQSATLYEHLLREMDTHHVYQQLDATALASVKSDPMQMLRSFPHHFQSMRLNGRKNPPAEAVLSGEEWFNMEEILSFARRSTPIKHWVLGFDKPGDRTFDSAGKILNRFKQFGFI